jgi:hypothetical protein
LASDGTRSSHHSFAEEPTRAAKADRHPEERSPSFVPGADAQQGFTESGVRDDAGGAAESDLQTPAYPGNLLAGPTLSARGNGPVRAAAIQQMQQTMGNRALQRFLHAQRRAKGGGPRASSHQGNLGDKIQSSSGSGGSGLDAMAQGQLEAGLDADLSRVRVHTDTDADLLARSVDAVAFTSGQDIFFRDGAYNPGTPEGLRLLAHEATHTVQQSNGPVAGSLRPSFAGSGPFAADGVALSDPADQFEQAAEQMAERIVMPDGSSRNADHAAARVQGASAGRIAARQVQRQPTPKPAPTPTVGWKDAPKDSPNAGETSTKSGGTLRIPLQGLPGGLDKKVETDMAQEAANGRAIALVPASIAHSKEENLSIEVLLHLHGFGVGYRTRKTQLTTKPNSTAGDPVPGGEKDTVRDISLDHIAEQMETSGRQVVGVLPQGDLVSQFGDSFNSDAYVKDVFDALNKLGYLPKGAHPGGLVLSAHSGGGDRIIAGMLGTKNEPKNLDELVLFDAIHGMEESLVKWLGGRIKKDITGMKAAATDDKAQALWLQNHGFRFRAHNSKAASYPKRYERVRKLLEGVFSSDKEITALGPLSLQVLRDNYDLHENKANAWNTGIEFHERLMGDSKGFDEALKALPGGVGSAATNAPALAPSPAPAPAPAPAPMPAQQPAVNRMAVQRRPVAVQRDDHDGHSGGDASEFTPERVEMSHTNEVELVGAQEPKPATRGQRAQPGLASVKESTAKSTAGVLAKVHKDLTWFNNFTHLTFMGRAVPSPVHIVLAEHLRKVEGEFVATFVAKPGNERYAGKEKEPATIAAAGDALGLSSDSGDFAGSRISPTSSAKISMHMFGLAIDLNYTANPWVGQSEHNLDVTNKVFARMGLLVAGHKFAYSHGLDYDTLAEMDTALEKYFSYLDDPTALQDKLNEPDLAVQWRGKTVAQATRIIQQDLDAVAGVWERDKSAAQKETIKKGGFMDISKELRDGMQLDWGGSTYGDMMHFDMRNVGIGRDIYGAIGDYMAEKKTEAARKYTEEHPATPAAPATSPAPTPAQPMRAPGSGPAIQRKVAATGERPPHLNGTQTTGEIAGGMAVNVQRAPDPPPPAPAVDEDIEKLNLAPAAKAGAIEFRKKRPGIAFTSGRRGISGQASAMAENIASSGNRKWIEETYAQSTARDKLQRWVDEHPDARTKAELTAGLLATFQDMSDSEQGSISKHLSGEAFDVQPQSHDAEAIKADIQGLPGLKRFLEKEGGLVRWHAQFKKIPTAPQLDDPYEREADRVADRVAAQRVLPTVQRRGTKKSAPAKKPAQPFFVDAGGRIFTVPAAEAGKAPAKIEVGQGVGSDTFVTVDAKGKPGVPESSAVIGTLSTGGSFLSAKKVKVEEVRPEPPKEGEAAPAADPDGMKPVTVTPDGAAVGIELGADGKFGAPVLGPAHGSNKSKGILWEPVELSKWPAGEQSTLQSVPEPHIDLPAGFSWVLMNFASKRGQAATLQWVPSKHSKSEYEQSKSDVEKEKDKLTGDLKKEVEKNLNIIASVSTVEGSFGSTSGSGDKSASLGIFQWAQGQNETSAGGSSLAVFFSKLKKRATDAANVEVSKRTDDQKIFIEAWDQCTTLGLDVDSKGIITLKQGKDVKDATGSDLEDLLSGTSGPMATGALRKYQLVAALDWIKDVKDSVVRPGWVAQDQGLIDKSYSESGSGKQITLTLKRDGITYTFQIDAPADFATVADLLTDEKAIAMAVSLGVNRPHFVETAMWEALTTGDPKEDSARLLGQLVDSIVAATPAEPEKPAPGKKGGPKVKKAAKKNVAVSEADFAALGKDAQQAYSDLRRLLWPAKQALDPVAQRKLLSEFKTEALGLYPSGERQERAMRLAMDSVMN